MFGQSAGAACDKNRCLWEVAPVTLTCFVTTANLFYCLKCFLVKDKKVVFKSCLSQKSNCASEKLAEEERLSVDSRCLISYVKSSEACFSVLGCK